MQNFATCLVGFKMHIDFSSQGPNSNPPPRAGSDEEHSSTENEEEMPLTTSTNKTKKSSASARKDWSIKNPEDEEDLIEWCKENTYMWLITDKDYMKHAKKQNALEEKGKELGVTGKFELWFLSGL